MGWQRCWSAALCRLHLVSLDGLEEARVNPYGSLAAEFKGKFQFPSQEHQAVVSVGLLKAATLHNVNPVSEMPSYPTVWAQCSILQWAAFSPEL